MPPLRPLTTATAALSSRVGARPRPATAKPFVQNGAGVAGVAAIGHVDPAGGGAENTYGDDFHKAGKKWTMALCTKDSDGDGLTNGLELGGGCPSEQPRQARQGPGRLRAESPLPPPAASAPKHNIK